jgi:hypothetical protein
VEILRSTNGRQTNFGENFNIQPKKRTEQATHGLIHDDDDDEKRPKIHHEPTLLASESTIVLSLMAKYKDYFRND